jgi:MoxR-like ATPase
LLPIGVNTRAAPDGAPGLENDEYVRKIEGYLPTAEVAFIDEIFKANSAILNALLTLLNERLFDNGFRRISVPLLCLVRARPRPAARARRACARPAFLMLRSRTTATTTRRPFAPRARTRPATQRLAARGQIGASNELPESEELDALFDRFLIRRQVAQVSAAALPGLARIAAGAPAAPSANGAAPAAHSGGAHAGAGSVANQAGQIGDLSMDDFRSAPAPRRGGPGAACADGVAGCRWPVVCCAAQAAHALS